MLSTGKSHQQTSPVISDISPCIRLIETALRECVEGGGAKLLLALSDADLGIKQFVSAVSQELHGTKDLAYCVPNLLRSGIGFLAEEGLWDRLKSRLPQHLPRSEYLRAEQYFEDFGRLGRSLERQLEDLEEAMSDRRFHAQHSLVMPRGLTRWNLPSGDDV